MIKLNRTTEYGLVAIRHMAKKPATDHTSAREISDFYGFPFEITAKTLQRLKDTGMIQSLQGARGGYSLQRSLDDISLGEFVQKMEGPVAVVGCVSTQTSCSCEYMSKCDLTPMMTDLNGRIIEFLSNIKLSDLADPVVAAPAAPMTIQISDLKASKKNETPYLS